MSRARVLKITVPCSSFLVRFGVFYPLYYFLTVSLVETSILWVRKVLD